MGDTPFKVGDKVWHQELVFHRYGVISAVTTAKEAMKMTPRPTLYEPPGITMDENELVALFQSKGSEMTGTSLRGCYRTKEGLEDNLRKVRAAHEQKHASRKDAYKARFTTKSKLEKEVLMYLIWHSEHSLNRDEDFEAAVLEKAEELYGTKLGRFETV